MPKTTPAKPDTLVQDQLTQLRQLEIEVAKASLARSTGKQKNTKLALTRDKIARLKFSLAKSGVRA